MMFIFTPKLIVRALLAVPFLFFALLTNANTAVSIPDVDSLLQQPEEVSIYGYEFVASTMLEVTSIGILDDGSDGLSSPHTVGIWDSQGEFVFQLIVPIGGGSLSNGFRYIDIEPLDLAADTKYVIGVYYFGGNLDQMAVASSSSEYQLDPAITIFGGRSRIGSLGVPLTESDDIYFGANFQFSAVPLPGAVWLMISALGLLGISKRRR
ncbi:MAG: VPLPA-CTERM sorting domain-containing protein [Gammaproteobacteria bacterium]